MRVLCWRHCYWLKTIAWIEIGLVKFFRNKTLKLLHYIETYINLCSCVHHSEKYFFFFCLSPEFLPVVGLTERWWSLRHLAQPCCVALGRALLCGFIQSWSNMKNDIWTTINNRSNNEGSNIKKKYFSMLTLLILKGSRSERRNESVKTTAPKFFIRQGPPPSPFRYSHLIFWRSRFNAMDQLVEL